MARAAALAVFLGVLALAVFLGVLALAAGCGAKAGPPPDYSKKPAPADETPYVPPHHHNNIEKVNTGPTQLNPRTKSAQYRRSRAGVARSRTPRPE